LSERAFIRGHSLVATPIPEFSVAVLQKRGNFVCASRPAVPLLFLPDQSSLQRNGFASRFAGGVPLDEENPGE
jgi:hypothetical protein